MILKTEQNRKKAQKLTGKRFYATKKYDSDKKIDRMNYDDDEEVKREKISQQKQLFSRKRKEKIFSTFWFISKFDCLI